MAKYETLPTISLDSAKITLHTDVLPELLHEEDSALSVMLDFSKIPPQTIKEDASISEALNKMKAHSLHALFVTTAMGEPIGIVASETLLGEQPIQIQQERRIPREKITVKLLTIRFEKIPAIQLTDVSKFKIGNIVNTLKETQSHFLLVINLDNEEQQIQGIFTANEIKHKLHSNLF